MKSEMSFDNICAALVRHIKKKTEKEAPTLPLPAETKPGSSQVLALRGVQLFQMRDRLFQHVKGTAACLCRHITPPLTDWFNVAVKSQLSEDVCLIRRNKSTLFTKHILNNRG